MACASNAHSVGIHLCLTTGQSISGPTPQLPLNQGFLIRQAPKARFPVWVGNGVGVRWESFFGAKLVPSIVGICMRWRATVSPSAIHCQAAQGGLMEELRMAIISYDFA